MASFVDMSLEDIIQKKREKARNDKPGKGNMVKKPTLTQKPIITDARNKIINKKRNQITDAREKLAEIAKQKDARLKLEQMRLKKMMMNKSFNRNMPVPENFGKWRRTVPNREKAFLDHTRQVRSQPRLTGAKMNARMQVTRQNNNVKKFMESRSIGTRLRDPMPRLKPILRTVENDIIIMDDDDEDDPMGEDYVSSRMSSLNRKASLNLKIIAHNNETREARDKRDRHEKPSVTRRTAPPAKEKSPPRLPSILKKRPMAALRSEKKTEKIEEAKEYRIIVSNLRSSVTGGDIQGASVDYVSTCGAELSSQISPRGRGGLQTEKKTEEIDKSAEHSSIVSNLRSTVSRADKQISKATSINYESTNGGEVFSQISPRRREDLQPEIKMGSNQGLPEYRIIVSNLRHDVTGEEIQELFGDVGGMLESRLVRPGTAEVIYKSQADAQRAVTLYHNRQLDGQPMNCLLVTPRSTSTSSRSSSKPTLPPSTNSNVEPDLSTFHKVLFSNF